METLLLATRWVLFPLYLALLASVLAVYAMVGRELLHVAADIGSIDDVGIVLALLSVLDLVLVANLLVMVAISSYESYISRIATAELGAHPEWLGKLDSGDVKLKVALSIVMISAIHLLRAFVTDSSTERLAALAGVHLVFVVSAVMMALVDRMHRAPH